MIKTTKSISFFLVLIMIFSVPIAFETNDVHASLAVANDFESLRDCIDGLNSGEEDIDTIRINDDIKITERLTITTSVSIEFFKVGDKDKATLTVSDGLEHFYIRNSTDTDIINITMSGLVLKGPGKVDSSGNITDIDNALRNGGVFANQTGLVNLYFKDMTFKNNVGNGVGAAAITNSTSGGSITIESSTIDNNLASTSYPSAIRSYGNISIKASTITNNISVGNSNSTIDVNKNSTIQINRCTITGNKSSNADFYPINDVTTNNNTCNVTYSIIAGNTPNNINPGYGIPDQVPVYSTAQKDNEKNLIGWNAEKGFTSMSVFGSDSPRVADNGGLTETLMLAYDSPVINQGHMALNDYYDQRGNKLAAQFDTGAVEVLESDILTVSLDSNGGSAPATSSSKYTQNTYYKNLPTNITKAGETFKGWFTSPTGGTEVKNGTRLASKANHALYAQWSGTTNVPAKQYTIKFNANGKKVKSLSPKSKKVTANTTIGKLPTPKRSKYNFLGWYTKKKGGTEYTQFTKYSKASDITLYAHWTKKKVVKFNANKGQVSKYAKAIKKGSKYGKLPTPKRDGYKFKGWYTKKNGGTKVTAKSKVKSNKNYTLYARWKKK